MAELISTRDPERVSVDYSTAIVDGMASYGGLYVAEQLPTVSDEQMRLMSSMAYPELAATVKMMLIGDDIPHAVVSEITNEAYGPSNFPDVVDGRTVPVQRIGTTNMYLQNLWLGPTLAFKDQALQVAPREIDYVLERTDSELLIVTSTSGDTGSAANDGVKGRERLGIVTLSPLVGMSAFQRAQMGEQSGGNVTNVSVDGNFDKCQELIKQLMKEPEFSNLGAMNSINIARIYSQVAYYFSGYFQTVEKLGEPLDVVVPTGNFGNILAGHIARRMGLPIRDLIIATNDNDVLGELFHTGVYRKRQKEDIVVTTSPSMDIGVASNFERLVHEILGFNPARTREYMEYFEENGSVSFEDFGVDKDILRRMDFQSGTSLEADRIESIRWAYKESGISIDPHTADAVTVARRMAGNGGVRVLCMSTASPVKFEETMTLALGFPPERPHRFIGLEERAETNPDAFIVMPPSLDSLREIVRNVRERRAT